MKETRELLYFTKYILVNAQIKLLYEDIRITSPRCTVDLSMREWGRMRWKFVYLSGYQINISNKSCIVSDDTIKYGN